MRTWLNGRGNCAFRGAVEDSSYGNGDSKGERIQRKTRVT